MKVITVILGLIILAAIVITTFSQKLAFKDRSKLQQVSTWVTFTWIALVIIGYMID